MTDEIVDYIRKNRATYTKEAISKKLLEAGHDQAAIDAAFEVAEHGETPVQPDRRGAVSAVIVVAYLVTWVAFVALTPMARYTYGLGAFILAIALTFAAIISLLLIRGSRALQSGEYLAWAVVISVALLVGVAGLCVPFAGFGTTQ
jgi:hypothetical protein